MSVKKKERWTEEMPETHWTHPGETVSDAEAKADVLNKVNAVLQGRVGSDPTYIAAVCCNGSSVFARYRGPCRSLEFLAQHIDGGVWKLPIHIIAMDGGGKAMEATIRVEQDLVARQYERDPF